MAVIMSQICWTNVTTGIQWISGATSGPLCGFIQESGRHKLVVSKKTIGSEGYCNDEDRKAGRDSWHAHRPTDGVLPVRLSHQPVADNG